MSFINSRVLTFKTTPPSKKKKQQQQNNNNKTQQQQKQKKQKKHGSNQGEVTPIDSVLTPTTGVKKIDLEFWALTAWLLDRHSNSPLTLDWTGSTRCGIVLWWDFVSGWPLTVLDPWLFLICDVPLTALPSLWLLDPVLNPGWGCLYRVYWRDLPLSNVTETLRCFWNSSSANTSIFDYKDVHAKI